MSAYRRQLVGLPLQQSLFGRIDRLGELLGLEDVLPDGKFGARVDANGDLHLDPSHRDLLAAALPERTTAASLRKLDGEHRAACAAVLEAGDEAARGAESLDGPAARAALARLGDRIAAFLPYGVLSKFVPDALLAFLRAQGDDGPPPFPARSAGSRLADSLRALRVRCAAAGWSAERLEAEWPAVDEPVARAVREFCTGVAGFGPLAWESPGYETPGYAFRMLRATAPGDAPGRTAAAGAPASTPPRPDPPPSSPSDDVLVAARSVLAFWLDFLEWETWYVRRAFYVGAAPLLRRIAALGAPGLRPDDLLFLRIEEACAGTPDLEAARGRRARYLADDAYLARHAVAPGRLAAMLEA